MNNLRSCHSILVVVIVCQLFPLTAQTQTDAALPQFPSIAAIDAIAERVLGSGPLAGLSVAVADGARIIHAKGYGYADLQHQIPANPTTVYRIGSITKQFTAATIMKLIEQGQLTLNDDLRKFFPDYPTGGRTVTIRQLLNHTSGIRSATEIRELFTHRCVDVTRDEMVEMISREPFDFEPGEKFRYNNSGPWLLGLIIERLTGKPYGDYLEQNVFPAIGLDQTYYDSYRRVIPGRASGYSYVDGEFLHAELNSPSRPYASGALLSTVLDLIRWQQALFSGAVVNASSLESMTSPGTLNDGTTVPYGFGLRVVDFNGHRKIVHGGEIVGFRAMLSNYPDAGLIIAVVINTDGHRLQPVIEQEIATLLLGAAAQ